MGVSIVKKKVLGGVAPCYKRLEDHRRCRGMTLCVDQPSIRVNYDGHYMQRMIYYSDYLRRDKMRTQEAYPA